MQKISEMRFIKIRKSRGNVKLIINYRGNLIKSLLIILLIILNL